MGGARSTYVWRRAVYRILVQKSERKTPPDIMQLGASTLQRTVLKLVSKFLCF